MTHRFLNRFALFTAACTFILIVAGGLVTSTESGLSVPDWPLSYGQAFPPMIGGIRFEHTHRLIAGFVGLLTLALMLVVFKTDERKWMKGLGAAAFLAVVLQAVLGGITVLYLLPRAVSVTHACLAQSFFSLITCLAYFTSREWREGQTAETPVAASLQRLIAVTALFIFLQLVVGALVRHGKKTDPIIQSHYMLAFLIFIHTIFVLMKTSREAGVKKKFFPHALLLAGLVTFQIFIGFGAFIFTRMLESPVPSTGNVLFTTAHQANGALILATATLLTVRLLRFLKAPASQPAGLTATSVQEEESRA